jgi:hypothetical protein
MENSFTSGSVYWERMRESLKHIETFPINAGNSIAMFYYQRVV